MRKAQRKNSSTQYTASPGNTKHERTIALRFVDLDPGAGPIASAAQQYTVDYTGRLEDGSVFDTSKGRHPISFVQGLRHVIAGWDAGFEGMRVRGKRRLFIPYQLAYGETGRGPVPAKANLVFDVELLAVSDVVPLPSGNDVLVPFVTFATRILNLLTHLEQKGRLCGLPQAIPSVSITHRTALLAQAVSDLATQRLSALSFSARINEIPAAPPQMKSNQEFKGFVAESFGVVESFLKSTTDGILNRRVEVPGLETTLRGIFVLLNCRMAVAATALTSDIGAAQMSIGWGF
jgi:FKBP-type peptidyl-prolyl cis-trans isomerase